MCDAAYLCQVDALERQCLSMVGLLPHLEEKARKDLPTVDAVRAEFDQWVNEVPAELAEDSTEEEQLLRLLGVAKGR